MILADIREITLLTEVYNNGKRRQSRPVMTKNADPARYQAPKHKSRLCRCGVCGACQDNERWNRIFDAKFADPNYYGGLEIRHRSPIHTI
jgi:hypothetical protein